MNTNGNLNKILKYKNKNKEIINKMRYALRGGGTAVYPEMFELAYPKLFYYIGLQIVELSSLIRTMPDPRNTHATVIRSIRSGGSGSFTNKINQHGEFTEGVNIENLYENTLIFWDVANNIASKLSPEDNWELLQNHLIVYRYVERKHHEGNIIQPIPMSCSWSIDFVKGWGGEREGMLHIRNCVESK